MHVCRSIGVVRQCTGAGGEVVVLAVLVRMEGGLPFSDLFYINLFL